MSVSRSLDSVICLVGLFLNTEPSELNTLIQYTHDVCKGERHGMPNACEGKCTKKTGKEERLEGVFVKKVDL